MPKEKENVIHSKKSKESDQDDTSREIRKESHIRCFTCDEVENTKNDCIGNSFKPISKFYCHNCHGYGHNVVDCKKPKFDNNNTNSRMFRNTKHAKNKRRFHNNESGERRQIVCYRCNNLGHIARNCKALDNQCDGEQRRNVPICQLCNKFRHTTRFYRMDKRNLNRNQNYRRDNRRNDDSLKEEMKEQTKYFKETFVKPKEPRSSHIVLEEVYFDASDKTLKSHIVCE